MEYYKAISSDAIISLSEQHKISHSFCDKYLPLSLEKKGKAPEQGEFAVSKGVTMWIDFQDVYKAVADGENQTALMNLLMKYPRVRETFSHQLPGKVGMLNILLVELARGQSFWVACLA